MKRWLCLPLSDHVGWIVNVGIGCWNLSLNQPFNHMMAGVNFAVAACCWGLVRLMRSRRAYWDAQQRQLDIHTEAMLQRCLTEVHAMTVEKSFNTRITH